MDSPTASARRVKVPSIGELVKAAEKRFEAVSDTPLLDAEVLMAHAYVFTRARVKAFPEIEVSGETLERFIKMMKKRETGYPVAYLIGEKEFWSFALTVTPDTLIPRPETEDLVAQALTLIPEDSPAQIADLGTGSGAIALAIAKERPQAMIVATDSSEAALRVARYNAASLQCSQVEFCLGSWFEALPPLRKFTLIISNPPYIAAGDPALEATTRFEPQQALIARQDGLSDLVQIISGAAAVLVPGGYLVLEHGYQQALAVEKLLQKYGFINVENSLDLAGMPRITHGQWPE